MVLSFVVWRSRDVAPIVMIVRILVLPRSFPARTVLSLQELHPREHVGELPIARRRLRRGDGSGDVALATPRDATDPLARRRIEGLEDPPIQGADPHSPPMSIFAPSTVRAVRSTCSA
jgi:hypothetical protein